MNTRTGKIITATAVATAAVMLSACDGGAAKSSPDTIPVTKITATAAPAPAAEKSPLPTTPTIPRTSDRYAEVHKVVRATAADAKAMWERATGVKLPSLTVVPETDPRGTHCFTDSKKTPAWACDDGTIVYRPEKLAARMDVSDTKIGPVMVYIAHEVAHVGMAANGFGAGTNSPQEEQAAMCGAGAYMRYVVEGKSTAGFTSTRDGALAAGLQAYPLDGSFVPRDHAEVAIAKYRDGFDSGQLCIG